MVATAAGLLAELLQLHVIVRLSGVPAEALWSVCLGLISAVTSTSLPTSTNGTSVRKLSFEQMKAKCVHNSAKTRIEAECTSQ